MALALQSVGDKLASTASNQTLYTTPASTESTITSIVIHAGNVTSVDIELNILKGGVGNSIVIFDQTAMSQGQVAYVDTKMILETTDVLRITTTVADVSYYVSLIEKT